MRQAHSEALGELHVVWLYLLWRTARLSVNSAGARCRISSGTAARYLVRVGVGVRVRVRARARARARVRLRDRARVRARVMARVRVRVRVRWRRGTWCRSRCTGCAWGRRPG